MADKEPSKKRGESLDEPQEFVEKIRSKIQVMREATGLSQEKFAASVGMDRTQWRKMETGVDMRATTIYRAIKALGTTPAKFFKDFTD